MRQDVATRYHAKAGEFRAEIYPYGVRLERIGCPVVIEPPEDCTRGAIEGFSDKAARRLREAFMTMHVEGFELWSVTLTTHRILTPAQWRAAMKRFRVNLVYAGWAGIWRVELQRRKAPHAHVAFWLPPGVGHDQVRDMWLAATGESRDLAAVENAVRSRRIQQDDTGWGVYMGQHDGKHKKEQLGWIGKQWGIWNRDALEERSPDEAELSPRQHAAFLRMLRNHDAAKRWAHQEEQDRLKLAEIMASAHGAFVGMGLYSVTKVQNKKRPLRMHRGNLLRLVSGDTVRRMIAAVHAM